MQAPVPTPESSLLLRLAEWGATAIGTAVVMVVGFRIWMVKMSNRIDKLDKRVEDHENDMVVRLVRAEQGFRNELAALRKDIEERHGENKSRQRLMDRRQMFTLKLVADVARKIGVDNRVDDVVIGFLTNDEDEGHDESSRR